MAAGGFVQCGKVGGTSAGINATSGTQAAEGCGGYGYGYPGVAVAPAAPPVYIQQNNPQPSSQPQANYWYYCRESEAYYPYVKECPGGWQAVAPQPAQR